MKALTQATKAALKPLYLRKTDRLSVSLTKDLKHFMLEIYANGKDWDGNPVRRNGSHEATYQFPARFPERKRLSQVSGWQVAATDYSATLITSLWPTTQLHIEPVAKLVLDSLILTCEVQDRNALCVARWRKQKKIAQAYINNGYTPEEVRERLKQEPKVVDTKYEVHPDFPLNPYQIVGLHCSAKNIGYGLFMEQGTGKTPIVIARVCNEAIKTSHVYKALIVCPKGVRMNWEAEFKRFSTCEGRVTVLRGGIMERARQVIDACIGVKDLNYSVVVCSYETMSNTWSFLKAINWDLAVLDESHYIKSVKTKRYKAAMLLRDRSKKRMILTGTPITNHMLDLYSQLEFLQKGGSGFSSFRAFKAFYGIYQASKSGIKALVGFENVPFIQERLARQSFIITRKEALPNLPKMVYDVHEVEMTKIQQTYYDDLSKQLALEIEDDLDKAENKQLVVNNVLVKLLRLAQITSGFITWDGKASADGLSLSPKTIERLDPNPKLDGLMELLKGKGPDQKTIIWACWRQDIKSIRARLLLEGCKPVVFYGATSDKDRKIAEDRFNEDPTCMDFIGNPAAGGTGINLLGYDYKSTPSVLTTNCDHEIYYSQNWSSVLRAQSEARPYRRGTRVQVRVTDLCVPKTIDEEIRARVMNKRITAYEIADVRKILANILEKY